MKYLCPLCAIDPTSHSLNEIFESEQIKYYYTCPSKAKLYYDTNSIINHYEGVFLEIPENMSWIWIFDGTDFNFKHSLQVKVGLELAKLISGKFSNNCRKIIIINPTPYISIIYNIIKPFLNTKIQSVIEINYKIKTYDEIISNL
jgi:hypothetical protein